MNVFTDIFRFEEGGGGDPPGGRGGIRHHPRVGDGAWVAAQRAGTSGGGTGEGRGE